MGVGGVGGGDVNGDDEEAVLRHVRDAHEDLRAVASAVFNDDWGSRRHTAFEALAQVEAAVAALRGAMEGAQGFGEGVLKS